MKYAVFTVSTPSLTTEEVAAITTTEENAIATSANQTPCTVGADLLGNLCLVGT